MEQGTDWSALVAGYAATVATWVAIHQFWTDRPRVIIETHMAEIVEGPNRDRRPVFDLTVVNAGRRVVWIDQPMFVEKDASIWIPHEWVQAGVYPFSLGESEKKTLLLNAEVPRTSATKKGTFVLLRDSAGRYWPRLNRWRMRWRRLRNRRAIRMRAEKWSRDEAEGD